MTLNEHTAALCSEGGITVFAFRGRVLRILTPPVLEYYAAVKEWEPLPDGNMQVLVKYRTRAAPIEDGLDLATGLAALGDSPEEIRQFLAPIQNVEIVQTPPRAADTAGPGRLRLTFYGFETLREYPDCWQVRDALPPHHAAVFARRWADPLITDMSGRELAEARALLRETLKEYFPCIGSPVWSKYKPGHSSG